MAIKLYKSGDSLKSFTLIELMVAMAVSILISVFLLQSINSVSLLNKLGRQKLDANAEVRILFTRIADDLKMMPIRRDIGYHMGEVGIGKDFLRFLSHVNSHEGGRGLSLVGYQLKEDSSGNFGIYRGVHGYDWQDIGFMGFDFQNRPVSLMGLPSALNLKASDYELISGSIFRVAVAFQYKNTGALSPRPPRFEFDNTPENTVIQMTNLASVVVCVATLDSNLRHLLTKESLALLMSDKKFSEIPEGALPYAYWSTNLEHSFKDFSSDIPLPVAQSIRVYQRFFPMP